MKIAALSMFYNEAVIAPFFLKHYEHLDEVVILLETDTDDGTREICERFKNVKIIDCHIEGGIDDAIKVGIINQAISNIKADWLYVLDSDELIFPVNDENEKEFLQRQDKKGYNCVKAYMYQVYRHRTEKDLDETAFPIPQRLHGDPDLESTRRSPNRDMNLQYVKPIIIKPKNSPQFDVGSHSVGNVCYISNERYVGGHWQMADIKLALYRRMLRKKRVCQHNKDMGWGYQHFNVTEDWIEKECERHLDDPVLIELTKYERRS